jgi:hypothetical protein
MAELTSPCSCSHPVDCGCGGHAHYCDPHAPDLAPLRWRVRPSIARRPGWTIA